MSRIQQMLSRRHDAAHSPNVCMVPRLDKVLMAVMGVKIINWIPAVPLMGVLLALVLAAPPQKAQTREEMATVKVQMETVLRRMDLAEKQAAETERRHNELNLQIARMQAEIDGAKWLLGGVLMAVFTQVALTVLQNRALKK